MSDLERQTRLQEIREHIARLGITEQDVADAVAWARANPEDKKTRREASALIQKYCKVPHK